MALLLAAALGAPAASSAQDGDVIKVVVAVLPFEVNSARPLGYLETSLADLLVSRLEASGRIEVVESVTVRQSIVSWSGERTESKVRQLARELGADYVVAGSLTELAGRYSMDVRVTPVESAIPARTMVFAARIQDMVP